MPIYPSACSSMAASLAGYILKRLAPGQNRPDARGMTRLAIASAPAARIVEPDRAAGAGAGGRTTMPAKALARSGKYAAARALDLAAFAAGFEAIDREAPLVMALGGAGTGKTTFLHELRRRGDRPQVFLAPTGVAALQLGGQTIHSFFGIPPRILDPDDVRPRGRSRKLMKKIERLVIDEVSMVRCDLLDVVDRCLRVERGRPEPFGGVQVVLVGDFLQLPPVVPTAEQEVLSHLGFDGPYAFDAKVLRELPRTHVAFTTVHRQTERAFIEHLAAIRRGERAADAIEAINAACHRVHRAGRLPVVLAPTNARVDAYNRSGLGA